MQSSAPAEVDALRRRTVRSLALKRIYPADAAFITRRLDEIDARIQTMADPQEDHDAS